MAYTYLMVIFAGYITARLVLRLVHRIAPAVGFVDRPDARRKLHEVPIPLGGGLAVWAATWLAWTAGLCFGGEGAGGTTGEIWFFSGLAMASLVTLLLGVVDDRIGLRGGHKLAGQLVAAVILLGMGFRIHALGVLGVSVELGAFAVPVTVFWILLVVNAFNLIDGMDGFCGSVGFVAALALALLAYWSGRPGDALAGLAIAGALAAFLKDNLPPARVYLGDAGSMTIGLLISALSIRACSDGQGTASLLALLALLALPLLDVLAAIARRWLTGHSLFKPDRGHLHHRLRSRLGSTIGALGVAVGLAAVGACGATLAMTSPLGDRVAGLALVTSIVLLVATDTFGGSELRLLLFRLRPPMANFLTKRSARRGVIRHECHLLGSRDWKGVWDALVREVEASADLHRVELAIDMPSAGETYHGLWSLAKDSGGRPGWTIAHSFHVGGVEAGVLRVAGSTDATRSQYLEKVEFLVRDLESRLEEETGRVPAARPAKDLPPAVAPDQATPPRFEPSLA
jgi:UDP-GlcNAc:undecaprenyl-phosphate/decaprenyl-phosphate GlcNAc-1-phosphate transferase